MKNENSVAFIGKIMSLNPIEKADKLVEAKINGWSSVVSKDIHKEGDLVLCITTDAVIPDDLAEKWGIISYLRKGNRVRTVKLRGVYSECILINIQSLDYHFRINCLSEGEDKMDLFKIYKYEPPIREIQSSNGKKIRYQDNPNFHVYHKFPNQKNVPNMFTEDDWVVITRKIHGTNARYGIVKKAKLSFLDKIKKFFGNKWVEYTYVYGSHNVEKGSDNNGFYSTDVWREIADKYDIRNKLWKLVKDGYFSSEEGGIGAGIIIYGEIYGPGIQGDKYSYNLKSKEFVGFDVKINDNYVMYVTEEYLFNILELPTVKLLYSGPWSKEIQDNYVNNQFIEGTNIPHEGVIVKGFTGSREKVSKVINPDYLIFGEKHLVPDSH